MRSTLDREAGGKIICCAKRFGLKKHNSPLRFIFGRNVEIEDIMESSGEPVSKYRDEVKVLGRQEEILNSGAPTCLGHRSIF